MEPPHHMGSNVIRGNPTPSVKYPSDFSLRICFVKNEADELRSEFVDDHPLCSEQICFKPAPMTRGEMPSFMAFKAEQTQNSFYPSFCR